MGAFNVVHLLLDYQMNLTWLIPLTIKTDHRIQIRVFIDKIAYVEYVFNQPDGLDRNVRNIQLLVQEATARDSDLKLLTYIILKQMCRFSSQINKIYLETDPLLGSCTR